MCLPAGRGWADERKREKFAFERVESVARAIIAPEPTLARGFLAAADACAKSAGSVWLSRVTQPRWRKMRNAFMCGFVHEISISREFFGRKSFATNAIL